MVVRRGFKEREILCAFLMQISMMAYVHGVVVENTVVKGKKVQIIVFVGG